MKKIHLTIDLLYDETTVKDEVEFLRTVYGKLQDIADKEPFDVDGVWMALHETGLDVCEVGK